MDPRKIRAAITRHIADAADRVAKKDAALADRIRKIESKADRAAAVWKRIEAREKAEDLGRDFAEVFTGGRPDALTGEIHDAEFVAEGLFACEKDFDLLDRLKRARGSVKITYREAWGGDTCWHTWIIRDLLAAQDRGLKITSVVEGFAFSGAAVAFSCSPGRRVMRPDAALLLHECNAAFHGGVSELEVALAEMRATNAAMAQLLEHATGQPREVVAGWMEPGVDTILKAPECLRLGLCDEISGA